jgi:hypothetical protein
MNCEVGDHGWIRHWLGGIERAEWIRTQVHDVGSQRKKKEQRERRAHTRILFQRMELTRKQLSCFHGDVQGKSRREMAVTVAD